MPKAEGLERPRMRSKCCAKPEEKKKADGHRMEALPRSEARSTSNSLLAKMKRKKKLSAPNFFGEANEKPCHR